MPLFFRPRLPLTPVQRVQIALLMRRTIDLLGSELPLECDIVRDWHDLGIDPSEPDRMLADIHAEVSSRFPPASEPPAVSVAQQIDCELPSSYQPPGDGMPGTIQIHANTLTDPLRTIIELANQYSHHLWHLSERLPPDQIHPNLTHLMPVCCGLAILVSNGSLYDVAWSTGGWQGWAMSRSGYYNASEIGYAAALLARHRGEASPGWLNGMRLDSRHTAARTMKYFAAGDHRHPILFDATRIPAVDSNPTDLANWLAGNDPDFAIAAGYAINKAGLTSPKITAAAMTAYRSKQTERMTIAIDVLSLAQPVADEVSSLIGKAVRHSNAKISIAALRAAHRLGIPVKPFLSVIQRHLRSFADDSAALIELIADQGVDFASLDRLVCQHLTEAILYSHDPAIRSWTRCLKKISNDPVHAIEESTSDPETREKLLALIQAPL